MALVDSYNGRVSEHVAADRNLNRARLMRAYIRKVPVFCRNYLAAIQRIIDESEADTGLDRDELIALMDDDAAEALTIIGSMESMANTHKGRGQTDITV